MILGALQKKPGENENMCSPKTTQKGGPKVREDEVGGYLLKNQGIIE